jgi:hypothetical protein
MSDGTFPGAGAPYGAPRSNGVAIAALVCGILALVISWIPGINLASFVLGIAAVICGILGIRNARIPGLRGRGMAIAGLVTGLLALVVTVLIYVGLAALFSDPAVQQQIEDALEELETPS